MYLGLDLRGGVHFPDAGRHEVGAEKKAEAISGDMRTLCRDKNIPATWASRATATPWR